jgi:hypothetical protein
MGGTFSTLGEMRNAIQISQRNSDRNVIRSRDTVFVKTVINA